MCVCAFFLGGGREPRLWGGRKQNEMGRKERVDNKFFVCRKSEMRYEGRKYNGHIILIGNSLTLEVDATRGRRDSVS